MRNACLSSVHLMVTCAVQCCASLNRARNTRLDRLLRDRHRKPIWARFVTTHNIESVTSLLFGIAHIS